MTIISLEMTLPPSSSDLPVPTSCDAEPMRSCTREGLPADTVTSTSRALLPHDFALTRPRPGGMFLLHSSSARGGSLGLAKRERYTQTHVSLLPVVVNDSLLPCFQGVFGLSSPVLALGGDRLVDGTRPEYYARTGHICQAQTLFFPPCLARYS